MGALLPFFVPFCEGQEYVHFIGWRSDNGAGFLIIYTIGNTEGCGGEEPLFDWKCHRVITGWIPLLSGDACVGIDSCIEL